MEHTELVAADGQTKLTCLPDELRTLFLFEALSDEQLAVLCRDGHITVVEPGQLFDEGDPATCLYVLIDGELEMSKRAGGRDLVVNRTSHRGSYCGAWSAFTSTLHQTYNISVRIIRPSKFFVLDAPAFGRFVKSEFPMAVHLLDGLAVGTENTRRIVDQHQRLVALGQLSAGLTHELNNPAAAIARAVVDLQTRLTDVGQTVVDSRFGPEALRALVDVRELIAEDVSQAATRHLSALETSDREDSLGEWLEEHTDLADGWDLAATFVEAGLDVQCMEKIRAGLTEADPSASFDGAVQWLGRTIETELLMNQIADASKRISVLLAGAKQYSQLDRAPFQVANVNELLRSTVLMFSDRIGKDKPIALVKDMDPDLPEIPCYPAELNQVWTNLIDNAIAAMRESGRPDENGRIGTLTLRTWRQDDTVRVEIGDTGPGIPAEVTGRIFEPFFTTKAIGEGTGLGLDLSWRIVVQRHNGDLSVKSVPGDTRFLIALPAHSDVQEADPDAIEAGTPRI